MNRENVIRALIDWNFWYREQFIGHPRHYTRKVLEIMEADFVADVVGVKRSGKSTIFNQIVNYLIKEKGVSPFLSLIINFEDARLSEVDSAEKLFEVLNIYTEETGAKGKPYIFLDEIHKVRNWEGFVRSLVDRKGAYVAVSGSTSIMNKGKVREVLSGRHISTEVLPLSFKEFLSFKGMKVSTTLELLANESEIKKLFLDFLRFGGFPSVVNSNLKDKILLELYNDILTRDVIENCKVRNSEKMKILTLFYISNIGNRISFRRLSRSLRIPLRTIERFTSCIQDSILIYLVPALSPSFSEMMRGEKKVYSVDQGLSNVVGYRLNESLGSLLENAVYLELRRRYGGDSIFYYRGKNEVDFIIRQGNEIKEAYQATFTLNDEREIKGLKEVLRRKRIPAYIITFDDEEKEAYGIKILKGWKWMLGFQNP
ncbi:ATPase AAA [Sulfolobales archaeon HS-7]|nr:ATPase AAA [Sulfolobales archaeon HS-7]